MSRQRLALLFSLLLAALLWFGLGPAFRRVKVPVPHVLAVVLDPYDNPILADYGRYRDALLANDLPALEDLARSSEGYLQLRTLFTLARHDGLGAADRLRYLKQAMALRIHDPLARAETQALWLERAHLAEAAGLPQEAVSAYREALPDQEAADALRRLVTDPYDLSNFFLQARMYAEALKVLGDLSAPSIEAPAYRALGEYDQALDAYQRWLDEFPDSSEARSGRAWTLFYLGRAEEADAAFAALPGPDALYGRGILARRAGEIDRAVRFFCDTGQASRLWYATDLLEAEGRAADAIPIYLELARGGTDYADDAAFRALVLAKRQGEAELAARARALLSAESYLGLVAGETLALPTTSTLPRVEPPVLELAGALVRLHDPEAAIGELEFALRDAEDEATTVAIAEALQAMGEFRQSQRAAEAWIDAGSRDLRTWRLAYPRAYPQLVEDAAARWDITPSLVWAVMRQESRFYPGAVSRTGAKGLMQFMPSTWDWMAELLNEPPGDPFSPGDNIRYGARYLSWLMNYFDGDIERAVPSYNGGQGYIGRLFEAPPVSGDKTEFYRFIDKTETRDFLQKVMYNYRVYQELYGGQLAEGAR
ncbi:MAG TPA: lytic transglycosylase domain-containing protein [Trueperaceae bacterium]